MFALSAIRDVAHTLRDIKGKDPADITVAQRETLYIASIYAGIVIAHNRTSYCHALGYFLTEQHNVPHGMACAVLLPHFIRRSAKLNPQRAEQLTEAIGMDTEALCQLVIELTDAPSATLTSEQMAEMAGRFSESANFKVAYGNFGYDEAVAVLTELFGG